MSQGPILVTGAAGFIGMHVTRRLLAVWHVFHIPLTAGVLLTALDTILVLWLTRYGIRLRRAFFSRSR